MEVGGGGRERGSGDRHWREMGEAASVWCGKVMATPCIMGLGCWANGNEVCRSDLGAHPKLGALVGALLECCF